MSGMMLAGCILVGFSLIFSIFVLLIARKPQLVIIMIVSAFFWLCSFLCSSIIWYMIPPIYNNSIALIPISVTFQEIFRYLFIKLYAKSERSFSVVSINAIVFPMTDIYSSITAG